MTAPPDLKRLAKWRDRFGTTGSHHKPLVKRHLFEPGERILVLQSLVSRVRQPALDGPTVTTVPPGLNEGGCVATDRRLMMTRNSTLLQEWRWADLANLRVARTAAGVVLVPPVIPDDGLLDGLVNVAAQISSTGRVDHARRDQRWWEVQGSFFAAHGRLDEWWSRVQAGDPLL